MYIEQLSAYTEKDWELFFNQFPSLTREQQEEVKTILTLETKEGVENYFPYLHEIGILNWIGPWYLMRWTRKLISAMFKWVRYEWHDIMYAVGGTERDRLDADYWLLKYSKKTIKENTWQWWILAKPFILMASVMQYLSAYFCYIMVVLFGRWWSFRYIKEEQWI